jgi:hypothetical protein
MAALHNGANPIPCFLRLPLRDPGKKERQITKKHMGLKASVLTMIERPELERCLQGAVADFALSFRKRHPL